MRAGCSAPTWPWASPPASCSPSVLRVFFFEKGAACYFHSVPFVAKLSLFVIVALLAGVVVILLCAALMARGIGLAGLD